MHASVCFDEKTQAPRDLYLHGKSRVYGESLWEVQSFSDPSSQKTIQKGEFLGRKGRAFLTPPNSVLLMTFGC